ncbi:MULTISPECIES: ABC transporter ATP-binding protein [Chromohalobacter]|uniref:Amino acid ABC transporter ATP-binding protein, PAAT family n=1 Tax=Chromohalobacter israelensis (strain ATCC BAA-138 / DSM 3043 / CIP 106854 / NCIMB 13768 / 1H11) TaxID=290398 RepID=Q1R061_CHRI1|nr:MULTISPECIES: amino acid ABC transporter ATP-binding protein [Chromohalobacter]ABE57897.1 amino acid ABC transporter ATP-binding protein, PAAT family [Chromohalobacter salexigens DSM 3043]MBZ5876035.1 amino acid ABC transporter ATP-binding protein [Chromohalobacter salexigens]MDF9433771.1 amino acid ABC transporter ATP-binding protein [Chromohalobacter israelensis]MDO0946901.1 amino acid ABC transporter ATP-binding protein [Chromohalobacter salexigens]NWO57263.1 amino acid ABC transporter A
MANHNNLAIEARHLVKRYAELEVIKDVSLDVREGHVASIIGSSGSGKSTLLRCMNLLETPDSGDLTIAGESLAFSPARHHRPDRRQLQRLRTQVSMVFQQFNLWPHLSVLGNVIEAPMRVRGLSRRDATSLAEHYLARVGMADKRDQYPAYLSGGQQQRVAIARALAMEPRVLLFDEPTSALDPELVGDVLAVIQSLAEEGRTMLLVTHEMGFARDVSHQVAFLHQGCVEEIGTPHDVFENATSERCRQFVSSVA